MLNIISIDIIYVTIMIHAESMIVILAVITFKSI